VDASGHIDRDTFCGTWTGSWLRYGNAVNFDVEGPRPFRNANENPRWWICREILGVYQIDGCKFVNRCAVDVAFNYIRQRRARRLQAKLQLVQDKLSLTLNRYLENLAHLWIEWW
jgi:hypothetical protein